MSKSKIITNIKKLKLRSNLIIDRLVKTYPDAKCELYYQNPFQLLMSVMLSAQTTDVMVNKSCKRLYEQNIITSAKDVVGMGYDSLYQNLKSIGLAPTKTANLIKLSQKLIDDFDNQVPNDKQSLLSLAGVGIKTANVVLAEIFNHPVLAVDTHVFRVTKRLELHNAHCAGKAHDCLVKVIDKKHLPKAHHLFIFHGRYTCLSRKPKCNLCSLKDICNFV